MHCVTNPYDPDHQIYFISDAQHLIKTAHNCFNLLCCGIEGEANESWDESELKVRHFVKNNLKTNIGEGLERVHRISNGPKTDGFVPIIVQFSRFKDKQRVLGAANKLKDTNYYIREDYSAGTRQIRRRLLDKKKELQLDKDPAIKRSDLRYRKLVVTGKDNSKKTYIVNDATNEIESK